MSQKEQVKTKLVPKQERFCQLYTSEQEFFANGVQSYVKAYKIKPIGNWYRSACVSASKLLSNAKVCRRINEILELKGLNDLFVDKQLEFLITQYADFNNKLGAIKEYNQLKQRIQRKIDVTSGGEKIYQPETFKKQIDDLQREIATIEGKGDRA